MSELLLNLRENELETLGPVKDIIESRNSYKLKRYIQLSGCTALYNIDNIVKWFQPQELKAIFEQIIIHNDYLRLKFCELYGGKYIFDLGEQTAYELFIEIAKRDGAFDVDVCKEICKQLSKEHAREIMHILYKHGNFYAVFDKTVKTIVPELCE